MVSLKEVEKTELQLQIKKCGGKESISEVVSKILLLLKVFVQQNDGLVFSELLIGLVNLLNAIVCCCQGQLF